MKCKNSIILILTILFTYSPFVSADKAIFAGGCFWCMEADFEKLAGVSEAVSGFIGGTAKNPTYRGDHAGHYEAVEVTYDPSQVSYKQLLDHFWVNIDPFDARGQFCDKGFTYLSAIFVKNEHEKKLAKSSRQKVVTQFPNEKVVTPIIMASTFFPIKGNESFHQNYYKNYSVRYNFYRWNCGRDKRLKSIWGNKVTF